MPASASLPATYFHLMSTFSQESWPNHTQISYIVYIDDHAVLLHTKHEHRSETSDRCRREYSTTARSPSVPPTTRRRQTGTKRRKNTSSASCQRRPRRRAPSSSSPTQRWRDHHRPSGRSSRRKAPSSGSYTSMRQRAKRTRRRGGVWPGAFLAGGARRQQWRRCTSGGEGTRWTWPRFRSTVQQWGASVRGKIVLFLTIIVVYMTASFALFSRDSLGLGPFAFQGRVRMLNAV